MADLSRFLGGVPYRLAPDTGAGFATNKIKTVVAGVGSNNAGVEIDVLVLSGAWRMSFLEMFFKLYAPNKVFNGTWNTRVLVDGVEIINGDKTIPGSSGSTIPSAVVDILGRRSSVEFTLAPADDAVIYSRDSIVIKATCESSLHELQGITCHYSARPIL